MIVIAKEDIVKFQFDNRTAEEQQKIAKMGGIASGEARREKKNMKDMLKMCMEMKNAEGMTYQQLVTLGLIKGAINGSPKNYALICEMLGELEESTHEASITLNIVDNSKLEEELYKDK